MSNASELKVLIAHCQAVARAGIKSAIEPHGLRVVAEASDAEGAVRMAVARRPDVCVISVGLVGGGIEAARHIKAALEATKVVLMSGSASDQEMVEALRAGAEGYLPISTSASRLPHAIRGVVDGEAALTRAMTARLILEFRECGMPRRVTLPAFGIDVEVTTREFEVLEWLRRRERTAEIASRLGISEVTVRRHIASLLRKLGMPNRRSAIEMLGSAEREEQRRSGSGQLGQMT